MIGVELRPRSGGPGIAAPWNDRGVLYLVGHGGSCRWSETIDGAALPLAVACKSDSGMTLAPVHPLCHVEGATLMRLGAEVFDVHVHRSVWHRCAKFSITVAVVLAAFAGGWCLKAGTSSAFPATPHSVEEAYVF